ncbi:MAG: phage holin family protein [Candidatus Eisenbacteria bacterium]
MLGLLLRWLLNALALYLTTKVVPGLFVTDATSLFIAVLVLGLLNALLRPVVNLFTGCFQVLTLGLLTLVINAAFFGLAAGLVQGFEVRGFWPAFWGSIVMSILSFVMSLFLRPGEKKKDKD